MLYIQKIHAMPLLSESSLCQSTLCELPLCQLAIGQRAVILAIEAEPLLFHRLSALGFRVGKPLSVIRRANFNGPLHVRLGTTDVILRNSVASHIHIHALSA